MPDEIDNDGNGNNPEDIALENTIEQFPGGRGVVDGKERKTITMENRQYASVLQQALHSIQEDKDFRQQLRLARWLSEEDWQDWCNAFAECKRYGAPVDWLINRLIAQSAGIDGAHLKAILETISHTTFTTNYLNQKKGMFNFLRNKGNDKRSPISQ